MCQITCSHTYAMPPTLHAAKQQRQSLLYSSIMSGGGDLSSSTGLPVVDLSKPRYDQTTYVGRAKHFFETANPLNVFVSGKRLEEAAKLIRAYK